MISIFMFLHAEAEKCCCDIRQILEALQRFMREFAVTSLCFAKHLHYRATASLGAPWHPR